AGGKARGWAWPSRRGSSRTTEGALRPPARDWGRGRNSASASPRRSHIRSHSMPAKPSKGLKLLFADDEPTLQKLMSEELPRMGHEVTVCPDGLTAVAALQKNSFDCLLVDLDMPGLSGTQVIDKAKSIAPDTEAVILTGKSTQQSAIAAVNNGTFAYLTKPCKLADLELLLQRVAEKRALMNRVRALERQLHHVEGSRQLVGDSPAMQRARQLIAK